MIHMQGRMSRSILRTSFFSAMGSMASPPASMSTFSLYLEATSSCSSSAPMFSLLMLDRIGTEASVVIMGNQRQCDEAFKGDGREEMVGTVAPEMTLGKRPDLKGLKYSMRGKPSRPGVSDSPQVRPVPCFARVFTAAFSSGAGPMK